MANPRLPALFHEVTLTPDNALVRRAVSQGLKPVGYTCSYVPVPLLSLEGLMPLRVRAPGAAGTPQADSYLSPVLCTYTRSVLEYALEGRYDFLEGWVFATGCDHLRRLHDNLCYLRDPGMAFMLDVPHKDGDEAVDWFAGELRRLAGALASRFGVDASDTGIGDAITRHNQHLGRLRTIGELRRRPAPPISGSDFHTLMVAGLTAPAQALADPLDRLREDLASRAGLNGHRARLLVVGSHLDDPGTLAILESAGGLVVADRFCTGSLPGLAPIPEGGDPIHTLAKHTLRATRCPRMMGDFDARVTDVLEAARDFAVDGVVVETLKFCDLWGVESGPLVQALRDEGLPVLKVEREYALTGEGQLKTRVQAFLESMGR